MAEHKTGARDEWLVARTELLPGMAEWLCLAAAPAFAVMALLTVLLDDGQPDMICSAAQDGSALVGMVPMYLLMSAFHLGPWLRLVSAKPDARRP